MCVCVCARVCARERACVRARAHARVLSTMRARTRTQTQHDAAQILATPPRPLSLPPRLCQCTHARTHARTHAPPPCAHTQSLREHLHARTHVREFRMARKVSVQLFGQNMCSALRLCTPPEKARTLLLHVLKTCQMLSVSGTVSGITKHIEGKNPVMVKSRAHTHTHTHNPPTYPPFIHTLAPSLPRSLAPSLAPSLPRSLAPSGPRSLAPYLHPSR